MPHLTQPSARAGHTGQRGAATLIVVLILFFVVSLVAAYTNRNLIFEQRTANNQYRSTQALEVAEAGLEWTIGLLNLGRVDGNTCTASTNTAHASFRQRYLNIDDTGRITPKASSGVAFSAACVFNGGGWQCSCPGTTTPSISTPTGAGPFPAFRVRFLIVPAPGAPTTPRQPSVIRAQVVGCTRADSSGTDPCLVFPGETTSGGTRLDLGAAGEGRVVVSSLLSLTGTASSPPQAAIVAKGNVGAAVSAYNGFMRGSGVTVQAGGLVTTTGQLVSMPGSPGGTASAIQSDPMLALLALAGANPISAVDRMFAAVFNLRPNIFQEQPAAVRKTCSGGTCTAADVRSIAAEQPGRPIWLSGSLDVDSAGDIGSATDPVLVVVNGNLTFSNPSVTLYGMVYVRTDATSTPPNQWATSGGGQVVGAAVTDGDIVGTGSTTFVFDAGVMSLLRWNTGSFVRVPGSWRDFEE